MRLVGPLVDQVDSKLIASLIPIAQRLSDLDSTIWGANTEAANRLNWVKLPTASRDLLPQLDSLSAWARSNNLTQVVLCGMGGSSLAPEVISSTYKKNLVVIDSTYPGQILNSVPTTLKNSVIVIGSKSGTTIETISHLKLFVSLLENEGLAAKDHLVIITDPGTELEKTSKISGYRVINADPQVGGRFSALSAFGLVPAALLGIDISVLLDDAEELSNSLSKAESPAIVLAALLFSKTDQIFNLCEEKSNCPGLSDWIEQLVAESTGKNQVGRLPVVVSKKQEAIGEFTIGFTSGDFDVIIEASLGEHFILWEWATALLCYLLQVDPFNQPNVAEAKESTGKILDLMIDKQFKSDGAILETENYSLFSNMKIAHLSDFLTSTPAYFSIMAYLGKGIDDEVKVLRQLISFKTGKPVTFGWGPRFLHSTGQLHKGGQMNGAFIQITAEMVDDLEIPGSGYKFSQLIMAQALGDGAALAERNLPVVRIHLKNTKTGIAKLLTDFN